MRIWRVIIMLLAIVLSHWCTGQEYSETYATSNNQPARKLTFRETIARKLRDVWSWVVEKTSNDNNVVGRCIGIARRLKFIMPLMVFKMGVIVTILIFLTIFSLKSLGLLVTLLFVNTTGWFAKLAAKEHEPKHTLPPQNVHFHVHPDKDKYNNIAHSGPEYDYYKHSPWDRNILAHKRDETSLAERLALLNLYNRIKSTYESEGIS